MIITNNLIQNYYSLYNIFKEYTDWIKKDTIDNVKMSINSNLLSIEDIYSINNLFEISLLDEEQYLSWIVSVTENYSYQELFHLFVKELPIFVQTYLIERVINIAENLSNSQSASYARKKDDLQYMSFGFNNLLLNNSDLELNNHDAFVNAEIYINNKLQELERNTPEREIKEYWESRVTDYCDYGLEYDQEYSGYGRYEGSYAQDEMGYSDDDIDTIFDGDPDAYWNID